MFSSGIPFMDMPFRNAMIAEKNMVIILLQKRSNALSKRFKIILFSIIGFLAVVFLYWGVSFLLPGLHAYA